MAKHYTSRELLEKLVSFPTVSSVSNLELVDWVEDYLDSHGVKSHRVYNCDKTKANLYANVGPEVEGGIILSGHTDVVPVKGQDWVTDPFSVVEKDGKLYGRGTCDMKGFDALALAAVPLALERGIKRPIQIALSYDEEVGCIGAPFMIDEMAKHLPRAAAAVIGEPSMMKAVSGHKGGLGFATHVHGFEVHSSLIHTGVSAVMQAAKLLEWANQKNAQNAAATPSPIVAEFIPPYTTLHVGVIAGGTAHNITAKDCEFVLSVRVVPGESFDDWEATYMEKVREVEAEMQAIRPETSIEVVRKFDVPALQPETDGVAEKLVRHLTGDNANHVVSYGTEAGQFQQRGYSSIICGPGSIDQAHQANEFIEISQFEAGEQFMHRLVDHLCEE
ncbi:MAG: acetylornithine deacetylase [Marinosulfonomonas sp.]|nr:MAG: acetylornithine deacetylase [Marinosulfonomonas sp.]